MTSEPTVPTIRKKQEFKQFLKVLEKGGVKNWTILASALGVSNDTITAWRKHPEAVKAHAEGVQEALSNMESSGKNDWRMWREKLRLFGLTDQQMVAQKLGFGRIETEEWIILRGENNTEVYLPKRGED